MGLVRRCRPATGQCGNGSTADLAALTGWPVILVLDVTAQAQTAAAVALGCKTYRDDVAIAGVILNRVGGDSPRARWWPRRWRAAAAGARRRCAEALVWVCRSGIWVWCRPPRRAASSVRLDEIAEAVADRRRHRSSRRCRAAVAVWRAPAQRRRLRRRGSGSRSRRIAPSPSSIRTFSPAGARRAPRCSPSRRCRRGAGCGLRRRVAAGRLSRAACRGACERRARSKRACARRRARRCRSTANAAATWCSAPGWRWPTATATRCWGCSGSRPHSPNAVCIWDTGARALFGPGAPEAEPLRPRIPLRHGHGEPRRALRPGHGRRRGRAGGRRIAPRRGHRHVLSSDRSRAMTEIR